jgi:hypothetical protein
MMSIGGDSLSPATGELHCAQYHQTRQRFEAKFMFNCHKNAQNTGGLPLFRAAVAKLPHRAPEIACRPLA